MYWAGLYGTDDVEKLKNGAYSLMRKFVECFLGDLLLVYG
jgi:hypothetical protein